jgi:hypothetical protein
MKENLDSLKTEIQDYLDHNGLTTFFGLSRGFDDANVVWWDVETHGDYTAFLKTAEAVGIRLIVLHTREMTEQMIEEAFEELEGAGIDREQRRSYEKRFEEFRHYEGFTCVVELSYTHEGQVYVFELKTEWFTEFTEMVDDLVVAADPFAGEEDDGSLGGFYSQN